ncbi:hypothetical protein AYO38_05295 [bacterium SCGC AG-212-C10]|nr:hypothetical protein AYO38_05295 [bacterium SCGC AG-212-C10]
MKTQIGPLHVRRSAWIGAPPERVWPHFESFEAFNAWYGTGHRLIEYEPQVGGMVVTHAVADSKPGEALVFSGRVLVCDPPLELTFEQDWLGHGWLAPAKITMLLTPVNGGTLVEIIHHGFEATSTSPGEELNGFEAGWDNHHVLRLRELVEGG